jgi:hypothetical protein
MMTHARRTFAAALFALAGAAALASGLPPQYASTPTAKDYPAADVLVLSDARAISLLPDGRVVEKVSRVEKMLTYQGMDEAGDPKIPFNKENQELTITRCRTYTPEGMVVDAKENSFNEMTPFELEAAPDYTAWREMVVTKVGLDLNSVVELEYTLADKKPWRKFLDGMLVLRDGDPCLIRQVTISVPQGMDLHYQLVNAKAEPRIKEEGGSTVYEWSLKEVPLARLSGTSPEERSHLPALCYTTCPDWAHWAAIAGGEADKAAAAVSPELQRKTGELVKGIAGDFEKMLKLQNYVAEAINDVHWPAADFDFAPRTAARIYESGYGHSLDKAVLFKAMAKIAGLDAKIGLGGYWPGQTSQAACLSALPRAIVRIEVGKDHYLLSPEAPLSEASKRDWQGWVILPLVAGEAGPHGVSSMGYPDSLSVSLDMKVAPDLSFEGEGTVTLEGAYAPYFQLQGSDGHVKAFGKKMVASLLPGADVTAQSVVRLEAGAVSLKLSFKGTAAAKTAPRALVTGLPAGSLLASLHSPAVSERDLPVVLRSPGVEKVTLRAALDPKLKVVYLPKALDLENAAGSLKQEWTSSEGVLGLTLEAKVPARVIALEAYDAWRDLCGTAQARAARTALFE